MSDIERALRLRAEERAAKRGRRPESGTSPVPPAPPAPPASVGSASRGTAARGAPGRTGGSSGGRAAAARTERQVELPLERLAAAGFVTPDLAKGSLTEEFRRVKRPILRRIANGGADGVHGNIVMVTSSVAGEGKTYTAINLAMSLASERERTVLLVDADVIKASAGRTLGIERSRPGLMEVMAGDRELHEAILGTDVPNLRLLPAGAMHADSTELLSSDRMHGLVRELAERYADRVIVLDCPPMLQTNEADVIAEFAGQIVFVVACEATPQRLVLEAMRRFGEDKSVGVLLNKAKGIAARYGHGYAGD